MIKIFKKNIIKLGSSVLLLLTLTMLFLSCEVETKYSQIPIFIENTLWFEDANYCIDSTNASHAYFFYFDKDKIYYAKALELSYKSNCEEGDKFNVTGAQVIERYKKRFVDAGNTIENFGYSVDETTISTDINADTAGSLLKFKIEGIKSITIQDTVFSSEIASGVKFNLLINESDSVEEFRE